MTRYLEFAVASNFSFLRGASHAEELMLQAAHIGLDGIGLCDRNSVAGVVRAHLIKREQKLSLAYHPGARLVFAGGTRTEGFMIGMSIMAPGGEDDVRWQQQSAQPPLNIALDSRNFAVAQSGTENRRAPCTQALHRAPRLQSPRLDRPPGRPAAITGAARRAIGGCDQQNRPLEHG